MELQGCHVKNNIRQYILGRNQYLGTKNPHNFTTEPAGVKSPEDYK